MTEPIPAAPPRLRSLDTFRGIIMVALAFQAFGLAAVALNHLEADPGSRLWKEVFHQAEHVEWAGCGFWDMIQPSFMFMVGVAMPFSYGARRSRGDSYRQLLSHAVRRSLILIFLGIFLISNFRPSTEWSLMNVLTQIGLGYTFLFLLWGRTWGTQVVWAIVILVGTWAMYFLYPNAGVNLETGDPSRGVSAEWAQKHLSDIPPAWHKNANVGSAIDVPLMNALPQPERFEFNRGGYATLNFLPSLATMLFGMMAGQLLRSERGGGGKFLILFLAGILAIGAGELVAWAGACPLVKRIWTPSWAVYSTGWCALTLAVLYAVVDLGGWRKWTFPLIVVGMNSIAIYSMSMLLRTWTPETLKRHLGTGVFEWAGPMWEPMVRLTMVGMVYWLICFAMYRQKIFVRV